MSDNPVECAFNRGSVCTGPLEFAFVTQDVCRKCVADGFVPPKPSTPKAVPGQCVYLGSKRRCCGDLYLCRKFPGESCVPSGTATPGVLECQTCPEFKAVPGSPSRQRNLRRRLNRPQRASAKAYDYQTTPFVPNPEWSNGVRHLTYHIWPTKDHDCWKWNLQQIANRWSLFNGKKILAIVTDAKTVSAEAVIEYVNEIGLRFDHVLQMLNSKELREVLTWLPMLELLSPETAGENEVVFSAHAKGTRHRETGTHVQDWSDLMYRSCLDNWPEVDRQLKVFVATGSFKRYNGFATNSAGLANSAWHYSGTFFWWRLAEIGRRNWRVVDRRFFGTESWLGYQCRREEAGCLFLDDAHDLYDRNYWNDCVWPQWLKTHSDHRGGVS